ncbi:MAG: PmeII family type II restriction endonuclease, partial [Planctomycetota bacterium]
DGKKSSAEGVDLEFEKRNIKYIVSIKSGPNWGNSGQVKKMVDNFKKAKRILGSNIAKKKIVAVNGCCYGRDNQPDKGDYLKLCGQGFWEFISDNAELYIQIVEPLGHKAKEKNEEFLEAYSKLINNFTFEFGKVFCKDGVINWTALVRFNSAAKRLSRF